MATDISVAVEDRPGTLAALGEALGSAGVNVDGLAALGGHVHLLVDDEGAARSALEGAGLTVEASREAVVMDAEDSPGKLGELTRKAADAGLNLVATYVASRSRLVFVADDAASLRSALGA